MKDRQIFSFDIVGYAVDLFVVGRRERLFLEPRTYMHYLSSQSWRRALLHCDLAYTASEFRLFKSSDYISVGCQCELRDYLANASKMENEHLCPINGDDGGFEIHLRFDQDAKEIVVSGSLSTRYFHQFHAQHTPHYRTNHVGAVMAFEFSLDVKNLQSQIDQLDSLLSHVRTRGEAELKSQRDE